MLAVLDEADSLNRNYLPVTGDSLLKEAARWFDSHGSANERVRAHYLLGCAYRDKGEAPAALQCYHDAVDCADTTASDCDYRLLSRVYGQMGFLFYNMNLPYEQIKALEYAKHYSLEAKDTLQSILCYEAEYDAYHYIGLKDSCLSVLTTARSMYIEHGYGREAATCCGRLVRIMTEKGDFAKARYYADIYEKESGMFHNDEIKEGLEVYYYIKGLYYLGISEQDMAEKMFRKLLTKGKAANEQEAACHGLSLLYKQKHMPDSAAKYAELAYDANDIQKRTNIEEELLQMQSQFDYSRHLHLAKVKSEEALNLRSYIYVISILFFIITVCLLLYVYNKRKERKEQEKKYLQTIYTLNQANEELSLLKSKSIKEITKIKEEQIQSLNRQIDSFWLNGKRRSRQPNIPLGIINSPIFKRFKSIAAQIDVYPSKEDWIELLKVFNENMPNFKTALCSYGYSPDEQEYFYCILTRLYFEPYELTRIFKTSSSNVSNIRARLGAKIFNIEASAKEFDNRIRKLS